MSHLKTATIGICLTLLGAAILPNASADTWDRKTVVTFNEPVEIPGVHLAGWGVLPPGTHVFKILDSQSSRHIVQIFNKEETQVYATILAIPNYRLKATDKTVVTFSERPIGQPEALRGWFYPGRNWGEEFVYPKEKAIELAKATNQPVLFTPLEIEQEITEPITSVEEPVVVELKRAPVKAIDPSGDEVELAQVVTPPPAAEIAQTPARAQAAVQLAQNIPETLPKTAGLLPLFGLLGMLALGGAMGLRFVRRRIG
jgi:hypothetical protein